MSFWCWHKWTRWQKIGDILSSAKNTVGFTQERQCEKCGYIESEKVYQV